MKPGTPHAAAAPRIHEFTSPLTIPGGDVAGADLVRELPPEVSLAAWQTLRCVLSWAAHAPAERGELFDADAMEAWECELLEGSWDADLRFPLAVLVGEMTQGSGGVPERVAKACLCVADWALARRATATALAFAEAAALSWPEHPRYAWMAGRLLRKHGRVREAEQWIRRAVRVAAAVGDHETQTLGLNSLGNVFYEKGDYRAAEETHQQALRMARRHALRDREGEVLHDLIAATADAGHYDRAERFARAALEIYAGGHPRLPALAYDTAFLWMKRGYYSRALPVLLELSGFFDEPGDRARLLSSAARAAAACGEAPLFSGLCAEARALAADAPDRAGLAHSMLQLGVGASSLGQWALAEELLAEALTIARPRGEADVLVRAEQAMESVRRRTSAETAGAEPASAPYGESLASRFVSTLRTAPAWAMEASAV